MANKPESGIEIGGAVSEPAASEARTAPPELIRAALTGTGTCVWEWNIDTDWLSDVDAGLALLGYQAGQIGHSQAAWDRLIHPDDLAANQEAYLRHARGEADLYEHAYRLRGADGQWRWMLERGNIVERHPDNRPRRMVGTQTDITAQRELDAARQAAAVASAANRAKTEFLSRMSHELRTPLNAVLGFAQLMEIDRAEPAGPGQLRRLKLIRDAGEHLLQMIGDMLDLTRIESGGMALQRETVALRALAAQASDLLRTLAEKARVSLELLDGEEIEVAADRLRLRQVLLNLLSNAIKYNRPGGRVVLQVAAGEPGQAVVSVSDTGVGIAEPELARVFEPFQRGSQAAGSVDGAGIGLAVTRALVTLMGGQVHAASTPGAGSVFSVRLPRSAGG